LILDLPEAGFLRSIVKIVNQNKNICVNKLISSARSTWIITNKYFMEKERLKGILAKIKFKSAKSLRLKTKLLFQFFLKSK
jgi:hypothetical protein